MQHFGKLTFAISTVIIASAPAWAANPDEGLLTRMVCYQVAVNGDLSTRRDFTVIVEQVEIKKYGASYFVPGNDNYTSIATLREPFDVYVYHDPSEISTSDDLKTYAQQLMNSDPTYDPIHADGFRAVETISINWGDMRNEVYWNSEYPEAGAYLNRADSVDDLRSIFCEDPFGVPRG